MIDQARWTMDTAGLIGRARIGDRLASIDDETVIRAVPCSSYLSSPPTMLQRLHGMRLAIDANRQSPGARRPNFKGVY
jgi:hypothetical protein